MTNIITALDGIKSILGSASHLKDPYPESQFKPTREWVHTDSPLKTAKYPRIQVKKVKTDIEKVSYGHKNYCDKETGIFAIYFYTNYGNRYPYQGATSYTNERLCEYYLGSIKASLKTASAQAYMEDRGIHGYVAGETSESVYNPETKVFVAGILVSYHWFSI